MQQKLTFFEHHGWSQTRVEAKGPHQMSLEIPTSAFIHKNASDPEIISTIVSSAFGRYNLGFIGKTMIVTPDALVFKNFRETKEVLRIPFKHIYCVTCGYGPFRSSLYDLPPIDTAAIRNYDEVEEWLRSPLVPHESDSFEKSRPCIGLLIKTFNKFDVQYLGFSDEPGYSYIYTWTAIIKELIAVNNMDKFKNSDLTKYAISDLAPSTWSLHPEDAIGLQQWNVSRPHKIKRLIPTYYWPRSTSEDRSRDVFTDPAPPPPGIELPQLQNQQGHAAQPLQGTAQRNGESQGKDLPEEGVPRPPRGL